MTLSAALLVSALTLAAPGDGTVTQSTSDGLQVKHCLVVMIDHVRLSASDAGPLTRLHFRQGAAVSKDEVLGQLDDLDSQIKLEAAQAEVAMAQEQADSDVIVRAAEKMAKVAEAEHEQALEINRKSPGVISATEVRRLKLTYERGLLEIEKAQLEQSLAQTAVRAKGAAVKAAENEIRRRKIVAPMDAIIDHVTASEGEWVQPGQPVFELVRIDKLRVEAFLNAREVSPHEVEGRPVVVEIEVRDPETKRTKLVSFESTVTFVSRQIVADGAFRIATDFDNRKLGDNWIVSPGMTATMNIKLTGPVQTAVAPAPRPLAAPVSRLIPPANK